MTSSKSLALALGLDFWFWIGLSEMDKGEFVSVCCVCDIWQFNNTQSAFNGNENDWNDGYTCRHKYVFIVFNIIPSITAVPVVNTF